jgi:hypothetical protein
MSPLTLATFCLGLLAAGSAPQEPTSPETPKARGVTRWVTAESPRVFTWNGEEVESQEPQATCPHCQKALPAPKSAQRFLFERAQAAEPKARVFSVDGDGKFRVLEGAKGLEGLEGLKQLERAKALKEVKDLKGFVLADPERFRGTVVQTKPEAPKAVIERRMDEQGNVEVIEIHPGQQHIRLRALAQDGAAPAPEAKQKQKEKQRAKGAVRAVPKPTPPAAAPHGVRVHRLPAHAGGTTIIILGGQGEPQVHVGGHPGHAAPHRIEISQLALPPIEVEGFELPAIDLGELAAPGFEFEGFEMPAFEIEGIEMPALELGAFEFPGLRFEGFRCPGAPCGPSGAGSCDASSTEGRREATPKAASAPASTRDLIHL